MSTGVIVLTKLKTAFNVFVKLRHPAWRKEDVIIKYFVNKVRKLYKVYNQIILDVIASNLRFLMPSYAITFFMEKIISYNLCENMEIRPWADIGKCL